tara:strand:+ start:79 stop:750 length:672 start_codon:yes stop_codon:yes gene_type:complete
MIVYFKNTLTRKNLMALTGLFLSFFLIIHLLGNLQLLLPEEQARLQYNWYSNFLSTNILVEIIAYVLYGCILAHTIDAIYLSIKSKKANGPRLQYNRRSRASTWYSRNMMFLGITIFLFLVIHFKDFWYAYKYGGQLPFDENGYKDLYSLVVTAFGELWYVLLYSLAFLALGFHLLHGVFSAHRSLGVYHSFYSRLIKILSLVFAIVITLGYLIIPITIYCKS